MAIDFSKYQVGGAKAQPTAKTTPTQTGIDFSKYQVKTVSQPSQAVSQPQQSLVSKAGEFIGKIGNKIFDTDEDLLQKQTNDLIQRFNLYKQQGKDTKGLQTDLKMIAKAQDPTTSPVAKQLAIQYTRLNRYRDAFKSSLGDFVSSALDYVTQNVEQSAQQRIKENQALLEQTDNEILKKSIQEQIKNTEKLISEPEKIVSRVASNKIKKWADEVGVSDPNFAEKLSAGSASMAGFALISIATGGKGEIPWLLESVSESGSTYEELRKRGLSVDQASQKANGVLLGNLVFNHFFNIFDDLGGAKTIKNLVIGSGKEGIQEGYQQVFQNLALDNPVMSGVAESALIGGLLGGATSLTLPENIVTKEQVTLDPQALLDKTVNSELAKTKEGKEIIKTALDAQEQGKQVTLQTDGNKVAVTVEKEVLTKPEEKKKPISATTEALPQEKVTEKTLFRGSKGEVVSENKTFDRVLTVENNQADLIKQLADEGNVKAKELYDSLPNKQRVDFTIADPIIREAFKDQYDAIQYNNQQAKQIGTEYHDLANNKFYAENEATAKLYAQQKRAGKYEGKEVEKVTPKVEPKKEVEVKKKVKTEQLKTEEKKTVEPKVKASKVAVSIEQKLGQKFENLAGFETINIKDQSQRVEKLLNEDLAKVKEIVAGNKSLPEGLRAGMLIKGVEEYATKTGDIKLLQSLATSPLVAETSIHAQELRLLAERDENSVLTKIQDLANERAKIFEKKSKIKADKAVKEEVKKIKEQVKAVKKYDWNAFVSSIKC